MIKRKIVNDGAVVFGVYDSPTTYLMIHYENKKTKPGTEDQAAVDVEQMFNVMERLDTNKGHAK